MKTRILAWWSGGVASAVACKWAVETFKDVRIVFIDTKNEHPDTYRFLADCERVYGVKIQTVWNEKYTAIQDVWRKFKSLNTANGAICSSELKREMRKKVQDLTVDFGQIFGFDASEKKRFRNMRENYPEINCIAPLIEIGYSKEDCISEVRSWGIEVPLPYILGFRNNNCFLTGCVQGGVGYWQKIKREEPEKVERMADMEWELTAAKGQPVTVLRVKVGEEMHPCFLRKHPDFPYCLDMAKGREPKPLMECHGFCNTKDYMQMEIDFETLKYIEDLNEAA